MITLKHMHQLEIHIKDGDILLTQDDEPGILLSFDQINIVISWLREAKRELLGGL